MKKIILLLLFSYSVSHAGPGGVAGNGGGAWVCRNGDQSIRWAQLVDLVEAQGEFGLQLASYPGTYMNTVAQIEQRMINSVPAINDNTSSIDQLHGLTASTMGTPIITYADNILPVINDSLYVFAPASSQCASGSLKYEQVVNYQDNGEITVQSDLFNAFSETSKAALVVHEGIYAFRREQVGETNSIISRRIVGLLFSTLSQSDMNAEMNPDADGLNTFFPAGGYDFDLSVMNSNGISVPISGVSISISGCYTNPTYPGPSKFVWEPTDLNTVTTDSNGMAEFEIPLSSGLLFDDPVFKMNLNSTSYQSNLAELGWARVVEAARSAQNMEYNCEAITLSFPSNGAHGRIDVLCVGSLSH